MRFEVNNFPPSIALIIYNIFKEHQDFLILTEPKPGVAPLISRSNENYFFEIGGLKTESGKNLVVISRRLSSALSSESAPAAVEPGKLENKIKIWLSITMDMVELQTELDIIMYHQ